MKYLFILLTLLLGIFSGAFSQASEQHLDGLHSSKLYYWVPPKEALNITWAEALEEAQWQVYEGELNFGYTLDYIWVMQKIQSFEDGDWVVQVSYPLLDYLDMYLFDDENKLLSEIHTGDARPFNSRAVAVTDFIMGLETKGTNNYHLLARLETQGTLMMPITWMPEQRYAENLATQQLVYGAYYGILSVMALYHLFIFFVVRERGYLYYVLSISAFILLQMSFDGRGFLLLWPNAPSLNEFMFPLAYSLYQMAILTFMAEFLQLRQTSPKIYFYFNALRLLAIVNIIGVFLLPYKVITPIAVVSGILTIISGLSAGGYLWLKGYTIARYFTCAWAMFLGGILLLNFRGLGLSDSNWLSLYGYLLGSILEVLFLAFSLADRISRSNIQKQKDKKELIKSQKKHLSILKRYEDLYEKAPTGNFQSNDKYQLISVNKACANIFGFSTSAIMLSQLKNMHDYLKSSYDDFRNMVVEAKKYGEVINKELLIADHNGTERWISVAMHYVNDDDFVGFEGSVQDVTERKNADKLKLELDQERLKIMEQFSLGIAKEINTPLGSNVATTAFIREGLDEILNHEQDQSINMNEYSDFIRLNDQSLGLLERNQKRITKVVKRFREVSAQHLGLKETSFSLADILREIIESQRWKMAGWRVNIDCPENIQLHSFRKAFSVIFVQLIDNALLHSKADVDQDPIIWIRVKMDQEENVLISFTDNGLGVKKELMKNLCQPFYTTKRGPDGHIGLGLYMVYNLVSRALNGRLLFPVTGNGFCVQLIVPKILNQELH